MVTEELSKILLCMDNLVKISQSKMMAANNPQTRDPVNSKQKPSQVDTASQA